VNTVAVNTKFIKDNYEFIYGKLFRYALKLTGNEDDAYDLVHDVVENLITSNSLMQNNNNSYYYSAVRNRFINNYRDYKSRKSFLSKLFNITYDRYYHDFESCLGIDAFSDKVIKLLSVLSIKQINVLFLDAFFGYSYQDIANILKIPKGTVMSSLFRVRRICEKNLTTLGNSFD
jgi:RNA polymerase sigma-70 factor (ECF subfamily)